MELHYLFMNDIYIIGTISFKKCLISRYNIPDVHCLDEILILLSLEILMDNQGIATSVEKNWNNNSMQKKVPKNYFLSPYIGSIY